jgi:hypothetical protein
MGGLFSLKQLAQQRIGGVISISRSNNALCNRKHPLYRPWRRNRIQFGKNFFYVCGGRAALACLSDSN